MTRELVVRTWCDNHASKGEQVPGEVSHDVTWNGMARTLDLCAECDAFMVQPLVAVLTEVSAAPDAPARGKTADAAPPHGPLRYCMLCDYRTEGTAPALSQHYRAAHDLAVGELLTDLRCPVCGERRASSQGAGSHLRQTHGLAGIGDAMVWAASNGDPQGAVAALRARYAASQGA